MATQSQGRPGDGLLGRLHTAALIALLVGVAGSLGLLLRGSERRPPLLLVLFVIWVLSPFAALVLATVVSKRWPVLPRTALYSVMLIVSLASLAIYGYDAVWPRKAQPAFVWVLVPPVSWLLIAIVVSIAALISGRLPRRGDGT